jgi:hypothetical protein
VRSPTELFTWLDTYVRLPNKVLITTRFREFKSDYPVEVSGMSEAESEELITKTASTLGIESLLTETYRRDIYQESDGHPYVIKILLGEVAKAGELVKVQRIVASKDEILGALFERTYAALSPVAKRVFLTLCGWRSTIPELALEAVLLRPSNERMDVEAAIDELRRSSFIEITTSEKDSQSFITVPLAAFIFGKRKLTVSSMKSAVEADNEILQAFGAAQESDVKKGVGPRVERLFRHVADRVSRGKEKIEDYLPTLEFVAGRYSGAWLLLASLYEDMGSPEELERAKDAVRRFLEGSSKTEAHTAWSKLEGLCRNTQDWYGEANCLIEACQLPDVPFSTISRAADRMNWLFRKGYLPLDTDEKRRVVTRLAEIMGSRIREGEAGDYGNLAWLHIHLGDRDSARHFNEMGLELQPYNYHLTRLAARLTGNLD